MALVAFGCGSSDEPTVTAPSESVTEVDEINLEGMVLHLNDVGEGARIGDDSGCENGFGFEGDSNLFSELIEGANGAVSSCFNQLEAPEEFINSLVVVFPDTDLAARAVSPAVFDGIVRYFGLDCCNGDPLGEFEPTSLPGSAPILAVSETDTVAILAWRQANAVGAISVQRHDGQPVASADAQRLATLQNERMMQPIDVPDDADDDRLVGLTIAPFQTYWIGETFAPDDYPAMDLYSTRYSGGLAELDYNGIRIEIFDENLVVEDSTPDQILGLAESLFDSPCTVAVPASVPTLVGEAQLLGRFVPAEFFATGPVHSDWGSLDDDGCPEGDPNVWMATIQTADNLSVRVNAPLCYNCLRPGGPDSPFHTAEGQRTIVAALVTFP